MLFLSPLRLIICNAKLSLRPVENSLRGDDRTYRFKADDEGMAHRWITALRAVQISCEFN